VRSRLSLAEASLERREVAIEFRRAETEPAEGLTEVMEPRTKQKLYLHPKAEITNTDIADAAIDHELEDRAGPGLRLTFTKEGQKKLAKLTTEHQGKHVAILVDGKLLIAAPVNGKLVEKMEVRGDLKKAEVERIVNALKNR
jgi:preprotein translocase subunit SecD